MIDVWPLFAVLGLFYFLEGLWWAPGNAVCFSRGLWGRFTTDTPFLIRRDARRGFVPPRHLVANGHRFLCSAWPIAISPDGIVVRDGAPLSDPETMSPTFIPYEGIDTLTTSRSRLVCNGKTLADTASPPAAQDLLRLCRALAASDKRLRAKKIIDWMDAALDHRDARRRMRRLHWLLRRLKWVPVALFANLFLIAPASVALLGYSVWYVPITLHVGLSAVAVITFLRASTKLRLARQDDRFATASMLLLFPPSTARYAELLSRDLLWSLHPIATALATLDRDSVRHLARQELMGWNTGRLEGGERESPCQTVEEWYRETFEARLLTALEGCGLHRQEILQPPSPEPGALTYCPRCHAQYRGGFEKCVDCDGLALLPHGRKIS